MKLKLNDRIEIQWVDAHSDSKWLDLAEAQKLPNLVCWAIGYVTKVHPTHITICCSRGPNEQRDRFDIPREAIIKAWRVSRGRSILRLIRGKNND